MNESDKRFCFCCGYSKARILEKLKESKWVTALNGTDIVIKTDGLHFRYGNMAEDKFLSKRPLVVCCEYCGIVLRETDVFGRWEITGTDGTRPQREYIITGYKCHWCGAEEHDNEQEVIVDGTKERTERGTERSND